MADDFPIIPSSSLSLTYLTVEEIYSKEKQEDRARESSREEQNQDIDQTAMENIAQYSYGPTATLQQRFKEVDQESSMERELEVDASISAWQA
ncbi:hypothetical protein [Nibribacter koreensis]|uniref:Uncharacterized protein n=1 Tax=Nibribacter koreensis TaxID=1084519 RepID=A0ABP8FE03_9BACT